MVGASARTSEVTVHLLQGGGHEPVRRAWLMARRAVAMACLGGHELNLDPIDQDVRTA